MKNWLAWLRQQFPSVSHKEYDVIRDYASRIAWVAERQGNKYCSEREYDKAIEAYSETVTYDPKSAMAYCNRGYALFQKHNYDRALEDLNSALAISPRNKWVLNNRACIFLERYEYDRAIEDCDSALAVDPAFALALCNRGSALLGKDDIDGALSHYERALSADSKCAVAILNRGLVNVMRDDHEQGVRDFSEAISVDPRYSLAFLYRGVSSFCRTQLSNALSDADEAVRLDPFSAHALAWVCLAQKRSGKQDLAEIESRERTLELTSFSRTIVRFLLGADAEEDLLSAARDENLHKERSQLCSAYFFIAEATLLRGETAQAVEWFQKAIGTRKIDDVEHIAAKAELKHITGQSNQSNRLS